MGYTRIYNYERTTLVSMLAFTDPVWKFSIERTVWALSSKFAYKLNFKVQL